MATLRSTSARWFSILLFTAIATATVTGNSKAEPPILALETSSVLSIKLEAVAAASNPTNESGNKSDSYSELVESISKLKVEPSDAKSFPGIYTATYTYAYPPSENAWLQEFDVIRFECNGNGDSDSDRDVSDDFVNALYNDEKKNNTTNKTLRGESNSIISCKVHFLISSEDEYRTIASAVRSEPSSVALSNHPSFLHSLEYNSTLTENWVHPRMKVVAENALLLDRRLKNKAKPSLRRAESNTRYVFSRNDNFDYSTIPDYDCYYNYAGTMDWIEHFVEKHADSSLLEVTWNDIGDSWKKSAGQEGYDIHVLTITRKPKIATEDNTAPFLIVSSTHAREYTPPILVRQWLEHLEEKVLVEGDPAYLSMLEHTKIHWIPYLNPDGRVIAETTEPFRRKNMNKAGCQKKKDKHKLGVDLNRNMPFEWGNANGSSGESCNIVFRGSGAGSEPETQALVSYASATFPMEQRDSNALNPGQNDYFVTHDPVHSVTESSKKWKGYDPQTTRGVFVDVHSYGDIYIYPWGNTNSMSPNDVSFRSAMGHLESLTGLGAMGPGTNPLGYVASGATDDWAYGVLGAFSMTWELGSEFHEPCKDFEKDYQKHFHAFEHLANIAPFPFALGTGPIVREIIAPEGMIGETIEISVVIKLPDVVPSNLDPIEFDDGEMGGEEEPPSSIATIRIFYGAGNPYVGATRADSTFANQIDGYWEIGLSGEASSSGANKGNGSFSYELSLTKNQLLEAFGDSDSENNDITTDELLYFQAMDDEGNLGPIAATRLTVVLVMENAPSAEPTSESDPEPTPTESPTDAPSDAPSESPSAEPTSEITPEPTPTPTESPTDAPTDAPSESPSAEPTSETTPEPTCRDVPGFKFAPNKKKPNKMKNCKWVGKKVNRCTKKKYLGETMNFYCPDSCGLCG